MYVEVCYLHTMERLLLVLKLQIENIVVIVSASFYNFYYSN